MSDLNRIGHGASIGRLLLSRDRLTGFCRRHAVVKASPIGLAGQAARAHMRYKRLDARGGEAGSEDD